jgi:hypothetical protein
MSAWLGYSFCSYQYHVTIATKSARTVLPNCALKKKSPEAPLKKGDFALVYFRNYSTDLKKKNGTVNFF